MATCGEMIRRAAENVRRRGAGAAKAFTMQEDSWSAIEDAMAFALAGLNGLRPGAAWAYHLNRWAAGRCDVEIAAALKAVAAPKYAALAAAPHGAESVEDNRSGPGTTAAVR